MSDLLDDFADAVELKVENMKLQYLPADEFADLGSMYAQLRIAMDFRRIVELLEAAQEGEE